jgi:hypothetical protein
MRSLLSLARFSVECCNLFIMLLIALRLTPSLNQSINRKETHGKKRSNIIYFDGTVSLSRLLFYIYIWPRHENSWSSFNILFTTVINHIFYWKILLSSREWWQNLHVGRKPARNMALFRNYFRITLEFLTFHGVATILSSKWLYFLKLQTYTVKLNNIPPRQRLI